MSELNMSRFTKRLAEQAWSESQVSVEKKSFAERFAEMMVEQCGVALDQSNPVLISRSEAYELIKKHFTT